MGNVEDKFVLRRIKHRMQGDNRLHNAEIRPKVAAMNASPFQHSLPHLLSQCLTLLRGKTFDILRAIDFL